MWQFSQEDESDQSSDSENRSRSPDVIWHRNIRQFSLDNPRHHSSTPSSPARPRQDHNRGTSRDTSRHLGNLRSPSKIWRQCAGNLPSSKVSTCHETKWSSPAVSRLRKKRRLSQGSSRHHDERQSNPSKVYRHRRGSLSPSEVSRHDAKRRSSATPSADAAGQGDERWHYTKVWRRRDSSVSSEEDYVRRKRSRSSSEGPSQHVERRPFRPTSGQQTSQRPPAGVSRPKAKV